MSCRLVRWEVPAGSLEGLLVVPTGGDRRTWPLVVDLHGGPIGAFQAGDVGNLAGWCARGFAVFRPEFRASGILGPDPMWQAFRGVGLPDRDLEAEEVLAGVAVVAGTGLVDTDRMFAIGHSYGAYLLNRIVTADHPFRAAVCWEGVADLRLLDPASLRTQSRWRGGSPADRPEAWAAASPVERAAQAKVPMLLVYGEHGLAVPHGENWLEVLRRHGVRNEYVVYADEGHVLTNPRNLADLLDRAQAWFQLTP
ncbi:alpha/beta hydrolase family protein [Actinopolymorpha rutila]|uniref:Dipeptidyl aminopeptidase/acylaminoacyl peptidase n=1 Tax=Actinopolymorpha rutila TaxID=446787 RepID=A0A852ZIV3_9ACTN|nr:prolyl oligopeptidase family serine peptidase [Actinopolymorpha rutila]NYH92183.1 dipeptidyl aminopeptidase/acylaminoacyl peptidase [Actinopolymorpha rutila]